MRGPVRETGALFRARTFSPVGLSTGCLFLSLSSLSLSLPSSLSKLCDVKGRYCEITHFTQIYPTTSLVNHLYSKFSSCQLNGFHNASLKLGAKSVVPSTCPPTQTKKENVNRSKKHALMYPESFRGHFAFFRETRIRVSSALHDNSLHVSDLLVVDPA